MPEITPSEHAMKIAQEKSIKAHRAGLCFGCVRPFSAGDDIVMLLVITAPKIPYHLACAALRIEKEKDNG